MLSLLRVVVVAVVVFAVVPKVVLARWRLALGLVLVRTRRLAIESFFVLDQIAILDVAPSLIAERCRLIAWAANPSVTEQAEFPPGLSDQPQSEESLKPGRAANIGALRGIASQAIRHRASGTWRLPLTNHNKWILR